MNADGAVTQRVVDVEDLPELVGTSLGTSQPELIDQARIDTFAYVSGDHQWVHTDAERATEGPFGATIAHGFLTLSLCTPILDQVLKVEGISMAINYGLDRVRFPSPLLVDSTVQGTVELTSVEDRGDSVQAVMRVTISARDAPKPCCVSECVIRFFR